MARSINLSFLIASLALAVFIVDSTGFSLLGKPNKSHNATFGSRGSNDRLVYRENIIKRSKMFSKVEFTKTFNTTNNDIITQVKAIDTKTDGSGAYAYLIKNGPGHNNVTLRFKSQSRNGIKFVVEIYARPRQPYFTPSLWYPHRHY